MKQLSFLVVFGLLVLVAGCSSNADDVNTSYSGEASATKVKGEMTDAQKNATSSDTLDALSKDKGTPTYSAPPTNAEQGASYRISPADPTKPQFQPDPKLAGGH